MTSPAAFSAVFADWKLIKTRATVQLVFEVPVEKADEAYQVVGGMPNAGEEKWFAIARLASGGERRQEARSEDTPKVPADAPPQPRNFTTLPLPQQAALLCADATFRAFMIEEWKLDECRDEEEAKVAFYQRYRITSRRDLQHNTNVGHRFLRDRDRFLAWKALAA